MTVAATQERVDKTYDLLKRRADRGLSAPTNDQVAAWVGMGRQERQPATRVTGWRHKSHEAGAVLIDALEEQGRITVVRGSNWRMITLVETGQVLGRGEPKPPGAPYRPNRLNAEGLA